ncbi:PP2C family protein-serine/threonine phosphatase [Curtobacterium sp. VKM Ac-2922]|uniref:PP2C family protein-serine/threonine phosphatase n=1 Tax=Curtobacterium sp. VKM Ac-2922 TaxID=2929475 RepID=UPI001FB2D57D|nr:PP2C family protein-serine/threonine phosphatase [Curtobacterium sp. VKM Ac-2922]MCJ1715792.1 serine/threonine-protein phosphatase [Curtobacterium sp. VKM Ac-2922]
MAFAHEVFDDEADGLDLDLAVRLQVVQSALLPLTGAVQGWSAAHAWRAAAGLSGDFAEWCVADDGRTATATVGDVMGKGTPAALLATHIAGALATQRHEVPAVAVDAAETAVRDRLERASAFATLFHGRLRFTDGAVDFIDAGHGFAAIGHAAGDAEHIRSADLPVGLQPRGFPRMPRRVDIGPGDVLLIASDGILELPGATFDTLTELATELTRVPTLDDGLGDFVGAVGGRVDDDLTLLAIRRDAAEEHR